MTKFKNNKFYSKIASAYFQKKKRINWAILPQNINVYEIFYNTFVEIYKKKPDIPCHSMYRIKKMDCLIWLIRKNPKILDNLPKELLGLSNYFQYKHMTIRSKYQLFLIYKFCIS